MTELSPQAQAVLDVYETTWGQGYGSPLAAALRAAADQLSLSRGWDTGVYWSVRQLLDIADELEGTK